MVAYSVLVGKDVIVSFKSLFAFRLSLFYFLNTISISVFEATRPPGNCQVNDLLKIFTKRKKERDANLHAIIYSILLLDSMLDEVDSRLIG